MESRYTNINHHPKFEYEFIWLCTEWTYILLYMEATVHQRSRKHLARKIFGCVLNQAVP